MFNSIRNILFGNINGKSKFRNSRYQARCIYNLVSFEQAKNMIESGNINLIDVRTENEFEFMHIKNAKNIPVDQISQRINEIDNQNDIMVYCASGSRSKNAIQVLNNLGYNNIYIWEYGALATFPYRELIEYGSKK